MSLMLFFDHVSSCLIMPAFCVIVHFGTAFFAFDVDCSAFFCILFDLDVVFCQFFYCAFYILLYGFCCLLIMNVFSPDKCINKANPSQLKTIWNKYALLLHLYNKMWQRKLIQWPPQFSLTRTLSRYYCFNVSLVCVQYTVNSVPVGYMLNVGVRPLIYC